MRTGQAPALSNPIPDTKVFCVPFVDCEGVIRGDQGKFRAPLDHNRDYDTDKESIYPECDAIKNMPKQTVVITDLIFILPGTNHKRMTMCL